MKKKTRTRIRKKAIAMILVMAIFAGILPDSFTAYAAEAVEEALWAQPGLSVQFAVNSAWGGSIAAEIILKNEGSKDIRDWKLTFGWEPVINSLWGAQYATEEKESGGTTATGGESRYTIFPYEYNSTISPGGEVRVGFIASGDEAALAEPALYEVEADGENWLYDTEEDRLYVPGETGEPGITEEPETTMTPEQTGTPEMTEEPEITATPEPPEVTEEPTSTPEPENTATPEPTEEPDYNLQDWEFTDDLTVTTDMELTKNLSCGNLYIKSGTLKTGGYRLTVRKDAEQTGGTLSVTDESTVTVKGNVTCRGGILSATSGELQAEGNFTAVGTGELQLYQENSHVLVAGDCRLTGRQYFNKGLLEVRGNLSIPEKDWLRHARDVNIRLSGDRTQTVTVEEGTYLYSLDLEESAGVDFLQTVHAKTLKGIGKIVSDRAAFSVENVTLEKDETVNCDVEIQGGTWNTGSHKLTVTGDLELTGGSLSIDYGEAEIQGDFHAGTGGLQLYQEDSHVLVAGDCHLSGRQYFNKGLLEVRGDLSIPEKDWLRHAGDVNIRLSGDRMQKVTVEEGTSLYSLDLEESAGVIFSGTIRGKTLRGIENIRQDEIRLDIADMRLPHDTKLDAGLELAGGSLRTEGYGLETGRNLTLAGGNLYLSDGSTVTVKGNVTCQAGILSIDSGVLQAEGDFTAAGTGELQLYQENSHVLVAGDCRLSGRQYFNKGLLEVRGNLSIPEKDWLRHAKDVNIRLSGDRMQTVTVEEGTYLYSLDLEESAGVDFLQTVHAKTLRGADRIVSDRTVFAVDSLSLEKDETIHGDVEIIKGTWKTGSHRLAVEGDFKLSGGIIAIDYGEMGVEGDFYAGTGGLQLYQEDSHVLVAGDCHLSGRQYFNKGLLEVRGDLSIPEKDWLRHAGDVNIRLSGDRMQKVTVEEGTNLYNLDISGSRGVKFAATVNARILYGIEKLAGNHTKLNAGTATPSADGAITGRLTVSGGSVDMDGHSLVLEKKLDIRGGSVSADAGGSRLVIKKNCVMQGGSLVVGSGMVHMEGDCDIGGTACIAMNSDMGKLYIDGSLTSSSTSASQIVRGDVYLKGHMRQTTDAHAASLRMGNASTDFKLHMTGDSLQTVSLVHPEESVISFADLTGAEEVCFMGAIHINDLDGWENIRVYRQFTLCGFSGTLRRHALLRGDLVLVNSVMHLDMYTLTTGRLEQYNTIMDVNSGWLHVQGTYGIYGTSRLEMTHWLAEVDVAGDFETLSEMSHRRHLTAGTFSLWGNLVQGGTNFSFSISDSFLLRFMQQEPAYGGSVQVVSQSDPDASVIREANYECPYLAEVYFENIQELDVTPSTLFHSFCRGVKDGIEESPEKMLGYAGWATAFTAAKYVGAGFGMAVEEGIVGETLTAAMTTGSYVIAIVIVAFLGGYVITNWDEIQGKPNQLMYGLGKMAAECLIIAVISMIEVQAVNLVVREAEFRALVVRTAVFIRDAWNTGVANAEEILFCFAGTTGILEITKGMVSEAGYAMLEDMHAAGKLAEDTLRATYGFIKEYCSRAEVSLRELRLILKNAGKMADEKLKSLTDWVRGRPEYYDRIEAEGTELLREEEAGLAGRGLSDKVDDILEEKCGKLEGKETLGLDDVEAVIEEAEIAGRSFWIEEVTPPGSSHSVKVYTDGNAQINTGKIDTYIRGKVKLDVEATEARIAELERIEKNFPEGFTDEMEMELENLRGKKHNYQRSIEMNNTLEEAGISDTVENNCMIAENLLEAAKQVTAGNTEVITYIEGTSGKVQIVSRWNILEDGTKYLATVILKPVKQ